VSICDHGRSIGNCPLCPVKPVQPVATIANPLGMPPSVQNPFPDRMHPVQKTDAKLEITDPTAKLAQEYAAELEELAAIKAAVTNTRSLLKGLELNLAESEKKCASVFRQLQGTLAPTPKRGRPKRQPVLEALREKEAVAE
jgi:hypothetical protein